MNEKPRVERVPATGEERSLLIATRPPFWEYLLFAADLRRRLDALGPKTRDHELRYALPHGDVLDPAQAVAFLKRSLAACQVLTRNVTRVLDPATVEKAFGAPGLAGDPQRIEHLAIRLVDTYEELLNWAAQIRGALLPDGLVDAADVLSRFADQPLTEIREFIALTVREIDELPTWARDHEGEQRTLRLELILTIDTTVQAQFEAILDRLQRFPAS